MSSVVISSTASDAHTWNLVYLQLLMEELGLPVVNLGACVPDELLVRRCRDLGPPLVVISSVNGHGFNDGLRVAPLLRALPELAGATLVIGGKLGIDGTDDARYPGWRDRLLAAGFDRVFGESEVDAFRAFLSGLPARVAS